MPSQALLSVMAATIVVFMAYIARSLNGLGAEVAGLRSEMAVHSTLLGGHSTLLGEHSTLLGELYTLLAEHSTLLGGHSTLLGELSTLLGEHSILLGELIGAVVVPRVRRELEVCADSSALFLRTSNKQCSATPVPIELLLLAAHAPHARPSSSRFLLTSAHCFFNSSHAWEAMDPNATIFFRGVSYKCHLISGLAMLANGFSTEPLDLSVVECELPVPVPPTSFPSAPTSTHEPVAFAGYSLGAHQNVSLQVFAKHSGTETIYARHVRITRLASSLQLPSSRAADEFSTFSVLAAGSSRPAAASEASSAGSSSAGWAADSGAPVTGYLEHNPESGMSGGPVLDHRCGLLGIIKLQSKFGLGGGFVRLGAAVIVRDWVVASLQLRAPAAS